MTARLLLFALLLAASGCTEPTAPPQPTPLEAGTASDARPDSIPPGFPVRGVYLGVLYDSAAAVVNHEAIPGVMNAMRMPIRVADRAELRGLREGDKIHFRLADLDGHGFRMSEIEPLPPETPLVLADPAAVPDEVSVPASPDTAS